MAPPDRRQFLHSVPLAAVSGKALDTQREKADKPKYTLGMVTYNVAAAWDLSIANKQAPDDLRTFGSALGSLYFYENFNLVNDSQSPFSKNSTSTL